MSGHRSLKARYRVSGLTATVKNVVTKVSSAKDSTSGTSVVGPPPKLYVTNRKSRSPGDITFRYAKVRHFLNDKPRLKFLDPKHLDLNFSY